MSTAPAAAAETPPPAKGKKKLIIIIAVAALVLAGVGGTAVVLLKKKAVDTEAEADTEADGHAPAKAAAHHDPKSIPVFVPLDPFTVNLADREAERYAQVGITLEIADAQVGERIKVLMPAIRNNILMAIADRTAGELLGREGKTKLAEKVRRETSRVLGAEVPEDADTAADEAPVAKGDKPAKKTKRKKAEGPLPVTAVHFSNFIIQ